MLSGRPSYEDTTELKVIDLIGERVEMSLSVGRAIIRVSAMQDVY